MVSTLLEILDVAASILIVPRNCRMEFQPFLRFWLVIEEMRNVMMFGCPFQPFLRFWGLCVWFLWVFKFFFGFL